MSTTVFPDSTTLSDPRLRAIGDRVLSAVRLAAFRAIAHSKDPKQFPMPSDAGALEHVFLRRLGSLSQARQRHAVEKASLILAAPEAASARIFRGLAQVDFRSAKSAAEHLIATAVPEAGQIRPEEVAGLVAAKDSGPAIAEKAGPQQNHSFLDLRLRKVTCFHEMEKPWEQIEIDDTIAVGGVTIDALGNVGKIAEIQLGDFDWHHNAVKAFSPPKVLATFDLRQGSSWPRLYTASIVLVEKDAGGGFGAFLNAVLSKAKDWLVGETGKALQGKVSSEVGEVLKYLLNSIVGGIIGFFVALFNDDVFPPVTETARVGSLHGKMGNGTLVSDERVRKAELFGADYELRYDWAFRS
jgi:hypothetical protein